MYEDEIIEELVLENKRLLNEVYILQIKLQESEKKYQDFVDEMFRNTRGIAASWVNTILKGV